jgi:DNA replication protein DnaC
MTTTITATTTPAEVLAETTQPAPDPAPVQSTCLRCGKSFATHQVVLFDRVRVPNLCPVCDDARDTRLAEWIALCPREFRSRDEGGFTHLPRMDADAPNWRKVLGWRYGSRGLLVRGESGHCKTRAMWRLLRQLFLERRSIVAMTAARFDRECRDAGGNFSLSSWFDRLATVDALFVDDLGKGAWTQATEAQFFDLIDARTREGMPILVTSNDNGQTLANRLSDGRAEPLIRRLRDYCECLVL